MEKRPTPNVLTGREGEPFDLEVSSNWTKNYRDLHPGETISNFFGREIIDKILAQEGCMGLRLYNSHSKPLNGWQRAMVSVSNFILKVIGNIEGEQHIIICGSTSDGNDMLHTTTKPPTPVGEPLVRTELAKVVADAPAPQPLDIVGQEAMPCPGSPGCPKNVMTVSKSEL